MGEHVVDRMVELDMRRRFSAAGVHGRRVRELLHLDATPEELVAQWESTFPLSYRVEPEQRAALERARSRRTPAFGVCHQPVAARSSA